MSSPDDHPTAASVDAAAALRQRAMAVAAPCGHEPAAVQTLAQARHMLHELQVHQIELQMQNEELQRVQAALDAERLRYVDLYERAPVGSCTVSLSGRILQANLTCAALLQLPRAMLIGRSFSGFVQREDADAYYLLCQRLLDKNEPASIEMRVLRQDGSPCWVHGVVAEAFDDTGQAALHIALMDISAHMKTREALHHSEMRRSTILQTAMSGFWLADASGRLLEVNQAYCQMSGYSELELLALHISNLDANESPDEVDRHIERVKARGHDRFESRHRRKNGCVYDVEISVQYRADAGGQFVVFVQDITPRRQAEHAMSEARQAAERASQAKSEFLASMSHELRTPMNAVLGFAQLMEMDPNLPERHKANTQEILHAGHHLLQLINQVLDLSRVESGHVVLSLAPVDVGAVVEDCLHLVWDMADQRGVALSHDAPRGVTVRADRTRLRQVLLNLLSNAIKYNRKGGSVRVVLRPQGLDRLRIVVIDTGMGIASSRLPELFQPFNRLGREGSGIEGSGIGLTITERLIAMMGGSVGVHSEAGVGSTFWVELPRSAAGVTDEPDGMAPPQASTACLNASAHTVLYIEDNPANLRLVAQMLGRRGDVRLLSAVNGADGIALAQAHPPALILLDIHMAGLDGYQTLALLRSDPRLAAIPVVAVTANAMPHDVQRGLAAGFRDYLTKPLDLARLLAVVDQWLAPTALCSLGSRSPRPTE